jgi:tetratricopeptide (TPR) repeat protein
VISWLCYKIGIMSPVTSPQRNRGVRASRAKLAHALTQAGLKTQVALAERIADIEGLDAAPKDVVNRVFRELPVDPITVERVARALSVEAHSLYKTADEEDVQVTAAGTSELPGRGVRAVLVGTSALLVLMLGAWWWNETKSERSLEFADDVNESVALGMGKHSLAVIPLNGDDNNAFSNALRSELNNYFNVARSTAAALTQSGDPAGVAARLRADVVIDGEFAEVGRLTAIRVYLFRGGVRQQVWADSVPSAVLPESLAVIATETANAVRRAVGLPVPEGVATHFPLSSVQDDYLAGELYMDSPSNELNVRRAQSRFEAALRQDANYARAHAGLCQALLEEYWMDNEERALKDASLACGQAVQLDPDDRVVAAAHAHFLQRTGRGEEAMRLYEKTIAGYPGDSAILAGLAASQLEAYRETGDRSYLLDAKVTARRAADIDPFVWKPLFSLATMEWFDGDVSAAIRASEAALERDENEYVLANLGSFYLCDGALQNARDAYARARELNPTSYVGDEFLGQAHYFLGDFDLSATLRQKAIDSVANGNPEIHEMWGNLADSYRQSGATEQSIAAYVRAAEIAERDYLRGTAPAADQAARAYYYTMLAKLDAGTVPESVMNTIDDELDGIAADLVSASALRRMAQTYLERGETEKARATLERATGICKGYAKLPDLVPLQVSADQVIN